MFSELLIIYQKILNLHKKYVRCTKKCTICTKNFWHENIYLKENVNHVFENVKYEQKDVPDVFKKGTMCIRKVDMKHILKIK